MASTVGTVLAGCIDARTGRIPNIISRGTALTAFAFAIRTNDVPAALWGAIVAGGTLLALYLLTGGAGIGLGDVKLATAIGAGYGPSAGIFALGTAFILGGIYGARLLQTRAARRGDAIRFGPFLAAGTVIAGFAAIGLP